MFTFSSDVRSYDVPFVFKYFDICAHTDTFKLPVDRQIRLRRAHLSRDLKWVKQQTRVGKLYRLTETEVTMTRGCVGTRERDKQT